MPNLICALGVLVIGLAVAVPLFFLGMADVMSGALPLSAYLAGLVSGGVLAALAVGLLRMSAWAWWSVVGGLALSVLSHLLFLLQPGSDTAALQPAYRVPESPLTGARMVAQMESPYFVGLLLVHPTASVLIQAALLGLLVVYRAPYCPRMPSRRAALGLVALALLAVGSAALVKARHAPKAVVDRYLHAWQREDWSTVYRSSRFVQGVCHGDEEGCVRQMKAWMGKQAVLLGYRVGAPSVIGSRATVEVELRVGPPDWMALTRNADGSSIAAAPRTYSATCWLVRWGQDDEWRIAPPGEGPPDAMQRVAWPFDPYNAPNWLGVQVPTGR